MELFRLFGNVILNENGVSSHLNSIEGQALKLDKAFMAVGSRMTAIGKGMTTFVSLPILGALAAATKGAIDLNETLSKTDVVFGKNSQAMKDWASNSLKTFGISKGAALDQAAVYGDMGTAMGLSGDQAFSMSKAIVGLTGDMASFKNMKADEIHIALAGIFTGETEALKRLGVVMTETNLIEFAKSQGITKSIKDMTQAEKVQLRFNYVMAASKNSIGDFQRTQSSAANQLRLFTEGIKESSTKVGELLLPYVTKAVTWLNKFMDMVAKADDKTRKIGVAIALVAAAIGPLLIVGGTLITSIGAIIGAVSAIGLPVIAAVAAIGALVAAIGYIIVKTGYWRDILDKLRPLFDQVKTTITTFGVTASKIFDDLMTVIGPFWEKVKKDTWPVLKTLVDEAIKLFTVLSKKVDEQLKFIMQVWNMAWPYLKAVLVPILNAIGTIVKSSLDNIAKVFKLVRQLIEGDWSGAWNTIKSIVSNSFRMVQSVIGSMSDAVGGLASKMYRWGVNSIQSFIDGIYAMVGKVKSAAGAVAKAMADYLGFHSPTKEGPGSDADTWIPNLLSMMVNGVEAGAPKLRTALNQVLNVAPGAGKLGVTMGTAGTGTGKLVNITVEVNNPKFFDQSDVDKFMAPVVARLKQIGAVGGLGI
jgi:hypothetical protein